MEAASPSGSELAHLMAPARAAPVEIPAKIPTSVSRRVHSIDSRGRTTVLRSNSSAPPELLEDGRDVAVVEVAQPVDHLPRRRLDRPDLHGLPELLAQEAPDAEQGPRRPEPRHEVRDAGAVPQDLGSRPLVVRLGVGRVAVLVEEDPLRVLLGQDPRHAHRAVRPLAAR